MAVARVYQVGAFVAYEASSTLELTQVLADDINVFTDSISTYLAGVLTLSIEDDVNVFTDSFSSQMFGILSLSVDDNIDELDDAILFFTPTLVFTDSINFLADELAAIGFDYALTLTDGLPAISDGILLSFVYDLTVSDDLSGFTDAILSSLFGVATSTFAENLNNYSDDVGMLLGMEIALEERLPFLEDSILFGLEKQQSYGDNIDNLNDSIGLALQAELTLSVADSINNLSDEIETLDNSRSIGANRTAFLDYIRRYLNDAGTN